MADECTIPGDGDIVGPGVRLSFYVQSITVVIMLIVKFIKKETNDLSAKLGLFTTLSLIITALIQYSIDGLHDLFLIEITQLVSLYLFLSQFFIFTPDKYTNNIAISKIISLKTPAEGAEGGEKLQKKEKIKIINNITEMVIWVTVNTLATCFNMWVWATVKQRLPQQECGDQVRIYAIISLNPIGGLQIFALVLNCILLFCPLFTLIFGIYHYIYHNKIVYFKRFDGIGIRLIILLTALLFLVMGIISIEMTIQKNPVLGVWDWNFGQIMIVVAVAMDIKSTIEDIISSDG